MREKKQSEFSLIDEFFAGKSHYHTGTLLGVGDDAAILTVPADRELLVSVDTMVEGVHFFNNGTQYSVDPYSLGHKLLAVNLSDLAAMGGEPLWATLALTIPEYNREWLQQFSAGLFSMAEKFKVDLVGGDTTRGPLTLTLQIYGSAPIGKAVRRSGAKLGDAICVTNSLGTAAYMVQLINESQHNSTLQLADNILIKENLANLERPSPLVAEGVILRDFSSAMVDVSDGLVADLRHICESSRVGAVLDRAAIPVHSALSNIGSVEERLSLALSGGDDYELCFTIAAGKLKLVTEKLAELGCAVSVIGDIVEEDVADGDSVKWRDGSCIDERGFSHF